MSARARPWEGETGLTGGKNNMNVKSVEKQEKCTVELVIEVGQEEFEAAV